MINLEKNKFKIIISGIAIIACILFFILYLPLVGQLKIKGNETKAIELELFKARNIAASIKTMENNIRLATGGDFNVVLGSLMKRGRLYHVNFISTKSGDPIQDKLYTMFPINFTLESGYKDIGNFLGSLDSLSNSIIKVSEFRITPILGETAKLKTTLTLKMYLLK